MAALRSFPPGGSLSANAAQIVQKSPHLFKKSCRLVVTSEVLLMISNDKLQQQLNLTSIWYALSTELSGHLVWFVNVFK